MLARSAVASHASLNASVDIPVANFATVAGDGSTTVDTTAKTLSITFGTTATSLRGSYGVTTGKRYRIIWTMESTNATTGQLGLGTSLGGPQYRPTISGVEGANFVEFTATTSTVYPTFQRASTGTTVFSNIKIQEIAEVSWADTALITAAGWTQLSSGVTVDSGTGAITIPATGTNLSARQGIATTVNTLYRLRWNNSASTQCLIGTANGGSQMKSASASDAIGDRTYEFRATTTTTWIQFQRSTSGTAVVSNIVVQQVAGNPVAAFSTGFSLGFAS